MNVKKLLLCLRFKWQESIYYEMLFYRNIDNSDHYFQQLDRLKEVIVQKRLALVDELYFKRQRQAAHINTASPEAAVAWLEIV